MSCGSRVGGTARDHHELRENIRSWVPDRGGRGKANRERIAIRFDEVANLGRFVGPRSPNDGVIPSQDFLFSLPDRWIDAGTWVVVYTGSGEDRDTTMKGSGNRLWSSTGDGEGRSSTISVGSHCCWKSEVSACPEGSWPRLGGGLLAARAEHDAPSVPVATLRKGYLDAPVSQISVPTPKIIAQARRPGARARQRGRYSAGTRERPGCIQARARRKSAHARSRPRGRRARQRGSR